MTADEPTPEQSSTEQSPGEQPSTPQPAADQLVSEQLDSEQSATQQPTAERTDAEQPATEQPVSEQPTSETPSAEQPGSDLPGETPPPVEEPEKPACRHEYVRIYQRKLKGLDRRLVATKAWLPVGFKMTDFSHLGEGSFCFCSKCRARLYPKRTKEDKAQARIALAASKLAKEEVELQLEDSAEEVIATPTDIHVEELEVESVELADIEQGAVPIETVDTCIVSSEDL